MPPLPASVLRPLPVIVLSMTANSRLQNGVAVLPVVVSPLAPMPQSLLPSMTDAVMEWARRPSVLVEPCLPWNEIPQPSLLRMSLLVTMACT